MHTPTQPIPTTTTSHTHTLIEQVQARKAELTRGLTATGNGASTRADIEGALAALTPMLTGDLVKLPDMVSRELSRWLEANKYLGVNTTTPAADVAKPAPTIKTEEGDPTAAGPAVQPPTATIPG